MGKVRIDSGVLRNLGRRAQGDDIVETDERTKIEYRPTLGKEQAKAYDSLARFLLVTGERESGKSWVCGGHKLLRHCWRNFNALAIIIVGVKAQATMGGIWYKLQNELLPEWEKGQGMTFSEVRYDEQKNPYIDVSNRHGGMSKIVLISAPHGKVLKNRIRGYEASYIFVEELTTLDGPVYYNAVIQQVGRRKGVTDPQQYVAATNPDGPSHWAYQRWFVTPVDPVTGVYNPKYGVVHIPYGDNINPSKENRENVQEATRGDPIEEARMLRGEWIDRPAGDAIFKDFFLEPLHIRPYPYDSKSKARILPDPNYTVVLGYDLGPANNAITFLQCLPMLYPIEGTDIEEVRNVWVLFDEMVYTGRKMDFKVLAPAVIRRMHRWNQVVRKHYDNEKLSLSWNHISDNSAFNQMRQATGSYDVMDFERESRLAAARYNIEPIKMRPAPKFQGSVETRIRLMMNLLQREEFVQSSACPKVKAMFMNLASEKPKDGKYDPSLAFTPKRSIYIHPFDSVTYAIMHYDVRRSPLRSVRSATSQSIGPMGGA